VTDTDPEQDDELASDEAATDDTPTEAEYQPRFRAATEDELDPQNFMVANPRSALRTILRGGSVAKDAGDATFLGEIIAQISQTLRQAAELFRDGSVLSNPRLRRLEFGHSVEIYFEISPDEQVQLQIDESRGTPTIQAAQLIGNLLGAESDQLIPQALRLGDAIKPYRKLLELLAADEATLEWQAAEIQSVVRLTSLDARHDHAILVREGDKQEEVVEVPGKLTMADSALNKFALTLPSQLARPQALKAKQRVQGTYQEDLGVRLKQEGLWDSDVMAKINVISDVLGTTATPRNPKYELLDAELLTTRTDD
jgi:hypothetical protein